MSHIRGVKLERGVIVRYCRPTATLIQRPFHTGLWPRALPRRALTEQAGSINRRILDG
jgi:hypothetical protein